jgi:phage shock protein A
MVKGKQRINCYIPEELYTRLVQSGRNITETVIAGIESQLEPKIEASEDKAGTNTKENVSSLNTELLASLRNHITSLESQIAVKDGQLRTKDDQIEKLNENMHGQVANIYNLTKDTNLLPETTSAKKKWWKFW